MVSAGTFWVSISYRLAVCFTRTGSTCGTEIYWPSFRHFVNYNYSRRKIAKNDKNGPKIEIPQILRCFFCTFSVFILLKFLRVVDWGKLRPTVALYLRPWRDAIVFKAPVLPVMVNGGRFEL